MTHEERIAQLEATAEAQANRAEVREMRLAARIKFLEARLVRLERPWLLLLANSTAAIATVLAVLIRHYLGAH